MPACAGLRDGKGERGGARAQRLMFVPVLACLGGRTRYFLCKCNVLPLILDNMGWDWKGAESSELR